MFNLCASMEFRHLPVAGGLYDQHPDLLDSFLYIFSEQQKEEERKRQEKDRRQGGPTPQVKGPTRPTH